MNIRTEFFTFYFLTLCFCIQVSFSQELVIKSYVRDSKWAHSKNLLAILHQEQGIDIISIYDPAKCEFVENYQIPDHYLTSLEWNKSDDGFLLGTDNEVFSYDSKKNYISKYIIIHGCGNTWGISAISIDPNSKNWAFISNCEAFPSLHIYIGKKQLSYTDFGIASTAELLCENDSIKVCLKPLFENDGETKYYSVNASDTILNTIKRNNFPVKKSFDGKYLVNEQRNTNESTILTFTKLTD
jgi:hypothetical protein